VFLWLVLQVLDREGKLPDQEGWRWGFTVGGAYSVDYMATRGSEYK